MRRCTTGESGRCWGKGLLCGLIGGFAGTILMTQFQNAWSKAAEQMKADEEKKQQVEHKVNEQKSENATAKAVGRIASLAGQDLSHQQREALGPVVHYSFGTIQGGLYGLILELAGQEGGLLPALIFGAALFGAADELAVPAMGLSGKPAETPLSVHLYALVSHLVYGAATEITRRGLRASL